MFIRGGRRKQNEQGAGLLHTYLCIVFMKSRIFKGFSGHHETNLTAGTTTRWVTRGSDHTPNHKQNTKAAQETKKQGSLPGDGVDGGFGNMKCGSCEKL